MQVCRGDWAFTYHVPDACEAGLQMRNMAAAGNSGHSTLCCARFPAPLFAPPNSLVTVCPSLTHTLMAGAALNHLPTASCRLSTAMSSTKVCERRAAVSVGKWSSMHSTACWQALTARTCWSAGGVPACLAKAESQAFWPCLPTAHHAPTSCSSSRIVFSLSCSHGQCPARWAGALPAVQPPCDCQRAQRVASLLHGWLQSAQLTD